MPLPRYRGHLPKNSYADAPVDCDEGRRLGCGTWCCRIPLVHIAREDVEDGLETEPGFLDLLRRDDEGACAYLTPDDRCSIWEKRPLDCRLFTCEGRECPAVLRPRGQGPIEPPEGPPLDETDCAHCGARAGFVAHFLPTAWRVRCATCGGPFLARVVHGRRPRLRVDGAPRSPATCRADRTEVREYLGGEPGGQGSVIE